MARGTRRPHAKRVRSKARKPSRSGGGSKGSGCVLVLFALIALPAVVAVVIR